MHHRDDVQGEEQQFQFVVVFVRALDRVNLV